jgi:HEAT repeats
MILFVCLLSLSDLELIRAQGARRRIEAITNACEIFDHYDEARHNIELYQGAAQALGKMQPDDALRMICSALEMVFRASTRTVQQSYSKCGSGLLTNLLHLMDRCEKGDVKHAHISILNITRILLYLSKSPDLRYPLCRNQDLLDCFTRIVTNTQNQMTNECRALRMRILANLAVGEKNKVLLYEQVGLLHNVLRIANTDTSDLARQHAATVLQELAMCTFLHVSMASNDQLLGTLVKLALKEKSMQTREAAITALQTLAYTKENRVRLVEFKDNVVLEALRVAISTDPNDKVRKRAAGALTNLASEDTAEVMGNHKGLLGALAIVATKDTSVEVQTRASLALTKIGNSVTASMGPCFETLLDSLVVASLSTTSNNVSAVLRVMSREPENRERMARHSSVLDTLADICVSSGAAIADRDNAMRTLMHLVNDSCNRLVMCNKIILDALVIGSNFEEPKLMDARESAMITLERLATEPANRPRMARHAGLLVAVSRAVEREAKWEDAKIESEHGYLAKPLLMSLLLAM